MEMKHLITETLSFCFAVLAFTCCAPKQNEVTGGAQPKDIIPAPGLTAYSTGAGMMSFGCKPPATSFCRGAQHVKTKKNNNNNPNNYN